MRKIIRPTMHAKVRRLRKQGFSIKDISRECNLTQTEVRAVLRGEAVLGPMESNLRGVARHMWKEANKIVDARQRIKMRRAIVNNFCDVDWREL